MRRGSARSVLRLKHRVYSKSLFDILKNMNLAVDLHLWFHAPWDHCFRIGVRGKKRGRERWESVSELKGVSHSHPQFFENCA